MLFFINFFLTTAQFKWHDKEEDDYEYDEEDDYDEDDKSENGDGGGMKIVVQGAP